MQLFQGQCGTPSAMRRELTQSVENYQSKLSSSTNARLIMSDERVHLPTSKHQHNLQEESQMKVLAERKTAGYQNNHSLTKYSIFKIQQTLKSHQIRKKMIFFFAGEKSKRWLRVQQNVDQYLSVCNLDFQYFFRIVLNSISNCGGLTKKIK